MKIKRQIVHIDEEKCDGCGVCVPSCAEGAIQVVDGKARLVRDSYCDGLGACLNECPQDAITIIEREADLFDEKEVEIHLASLTASTAKPEPAACGCPGAAMRTFIREEAPQTEPSGIPARSSLMSWPVQITLVPPTAPYLQNADLLITADCVPYALPDYHSRFIKGRIPLVGCPKLDDLGFYRAKFEEIFRVAKPKSITVLRMEVPCCAGIVLAAQEAAKAAAPETPFDVKIIGIEGGVREFTYV